MLAIARRVSSENPRGGGTQLDTHGRRDGSQGLLSRGADRGCRFLARQATWIDRQASSDRVRGALERSERCNAAPSPTARAADGVRADLEVIGTGSIHMRRGCSTSKPAMTIAVDVSRAVSRPPSTPAAMQAHGRPQRRRENGRPARAVALGPGGNCAFRLAALARQWAHPGSGIEARASSSNAGDPVSSWLLR